MIAHRFRALVVDDEPQARMVMANALALEGFDCDVASDGLEAIERLAAHNYDLVVTDLRMPKHNGHSLAIELMGLRESPVVIVHTAVFDPRLTKDLIHRGIDDVVFKPTPVRPFAAKARAMVESRRGQSIPSVSSGELDQLRNIADAAGSSSILEWQELERHLSRVSNVLPTSGAVIDVYHMTCTDDCGADDIAAAIQRDPSLTAELLRIGNSSYYNPQLEKNIDLRQIVLRIGRRRVGEMALAATILSSTATDVIPWMDVDLLRKQSVAAGIAVGVIAEQGRLRNLEHGLLLSATMASLGRLVLGSLFPGLYEQIMAGYLTEGGTLLEHENRVFPKNHAEIMGHLLSEWSVASDVCFPLKNVLDSYPSFTSLSGPTRQKAEIVKLAVLVGRIAVGEWEDWDAVELPPPEVLKRLRVHSLPDIIKRTRSELQAVLPPENAELSGGDEEGMADSIGRKCHCCCLFDPNLDALIPLLSSIGIEPLQCTPEDFSHIERGSLVTVNCVGVDPKLVSRLTAKSSAADVRIICESESEAAYSGYGEVLTLPAASIQFVAHCSPDSHHAGGKELSQPASRLESVLR